MIKTKKSSTTGLEARTTNSPKRQTASEGIAMPWSPPRPRARPRERLSSPRPESAAMMKWRRALRPHGRPRPPHPPPKTTTYSPRPPATPPPRHSLPPPMASLPPSPRPPLFASPRLPLSASTPKPYLPPLRLHLPPLTSPPPPPPPPYLTPPLSRPNCSKRSQPTTCP